MKLSLTLLAGISKQAREAKNLLLLTDIQKEILTGNTLGDVTIRLEGKLKFEQQYNKKEYVNHLYKIFKDYVNVPPAIREIKGGGASDRFSVWFQTFQHNEFKIFRNVFYKEVKVKDEDGNLIIKNEKVVYKKGITDVAFLQQWLTPRAVAYWFMDDGSYKNDKKYRKIGFSLSTHGFTEDENIILSNMLNEKYKLHTIVRRDVTHYYIDFLVKDLIPFRNLIAPFIHPCFYYKLFDNYNSLNEKVL